MKRVPGSIRFLLMLALLLVFSSVLAQARIGYVDMGRVLDEAPQVAAGRAVLNAEFRARNDAWRTKQSRLDEMERRLFSATGDAQQGDLQRRVNALRREVRDAGEDLRADVNIRLNELLAEVEKDIHAAIEKLGREQGYDLIISSPVEYASKQVDLTDDVLQRLQAMFRQSSSTVSE